MLLKTLQERFEANSDRHPGVTWPAVQTRLKAHPAKLRSLDQMEATGGEPDVVAHNKRTGAVTFFDCAAQTPAVRTSLCYDREALDARKMAKPKGSAMEMAAAMGATILTEEQYRELQSLGEFDTKRSSWLWTPSEIRRLGGALFGDRRFGRVFVYHNGAESYYAGRGFRCALSV